MKEMLLLAREIGLPDNDIRDIDEYINHNERGLAFEVLCSSIQQYGLKVSDDQELMVWNAWEDDKGGLEAWVRGAAMKKEVIAPNHFRYYCNDGHIDDNFDALIFDIIIE